MGEDERWKTAMFVVRHGRYILGLFRRNGLMVVFVVDGWAVWAYDDSKSAECRDETRLVC